MKIVYLSPEEILRLHFQLIEDFGGSHGVRSEQRILSFVESPAQSTTRGDLYSSVFDKAAVYFRNIVSDHAFIDGNKRTAVVVTGIFLKRNGVSLTASPEDLEQFTIQIVVEHLGIAEISQWLESHSL